MEKYLVTYWSQITLILLGIGYLIQQAVNYSLKLKEIRFSSLHLERAQVVRKLYSDLMALQKDIDAMHLAHELKPLDLGPTREEWLPIFQSMITRNRDIKEYFEMNRILFSKKFASKMNNLFIMVTRNFIITSANKNNIINDPSKDLILNDSLMFKKFYKSNFKELFTALEDEFRKYL